MAYERTIAPPSILPHCGYSVIRSAYQLLNRFPKRSVKGGLLYFEKALIARFFPFVLFLFYSANELWAQENAPLNTFDEPGLFTWVCPPEITCIKVECWGGGGRGGNRTSSGAGGGGGGGAFSRGSAITVVPGNTYYINVGNGSATTFPGGDSWFGPTIQPVDAVTLAKGGSSETDNGMLGASGGSAAGGVGDQKYNGGRGGRALSGNSGGGGGGAGTMGSGGGANAEIAGTGTPLFGGNGGDGLLINGSGMDGYPCGGGGSGEKRDTTDYIAGNGAHGQVIIAYISLYQITPFNESFCDGDTINIGLSGSESGVSYQLLRNAIPAGTPVGGTGNAISFGNQTATGTYTVSASLDSSACTRLMSGYVVINPGPVVTLTGPSLVCTGSTGNIYTTQAGMINYQWSVSPGGTVTAGGTPADNTITITWNTAGTGSVSVNYANSYGCMAISPAVYTVTITQQSGDPSSASANPSTICNGQNATLTLTGGGGGAGTIIRWYTGSCGGMPAGEGNSLVVSPASSTTYYGRYEDQAPCGNTSCAQVTVTVNQKSGNPTSATATPASICEGQSTSLTLNGGGGGTGEVVHWYTGSCGGTAVGTGNGLAVSPAVTTTYYGRYEDPAPCSWNTSCAAVTVTVYPNPAATLSASPATICLNESSILTATSSGGTVSSVYSGASGTINLPIPQNSNSSYPYSTIPLNSGGLNISATDIVQVTLNITHTRDSDLDIFLVNPSSSGAMLLSRDNGGNGDNYTNTILKTDAVVSITTGSAPFSGTYLPQGSITTPPDRTGATGGLTYNAVVPANALIGLPIDGAWSLRVFDDQGGGQQGGNTGILVSWSLSITRPIGVYTSVFNGPGTFGPVTYSGPYNSIATVSVTPPAGVNSYTVTVTDAMGCPVTSAAVDVTVNPLPVASITSDYCSFPGYIQLTAHPGPAGYTYVWNTIPPQYTQSIYIDIVGSYTVTVTSSSTGCTNTATFTSTEYVVNGSFTNVPPPFDWETPGCPACYVYQPDIPGNTELIPEGLYGVGPDAHTYHPNFWGPGHYGTGDNYMIVNGYPGAPQPIVWQETITGLTIGKKYYFAAFATSLNTAGNYANLKFSINGGQIGVPTGPLPAGPSGNGGPFEWIRFYGNWTANSTTAVLSIIDLQFAPGGNDFGLDDISFSTLEPPPYVSSPEANGGGPVCLGGILNLSANVTGGVGPFSFFWTGPDGWTSNQQNPVRNPVTVPMGGMYSVLITDLGTACPGSTHYVTVTILTPPACSISGTDGPVCPSTSTIYAAPEGMSSYAWSISGNGTIVGANDEQTVAITAGTACNAVFTLTLDIMASNGCGSLCEKMVNVNDTIAPLITCPGNIDVMADPGMTYATISLPPPSYSDNCTSEPGILISWIMTPPTAGSGNGIIPIPYPFNVGITTVTYIATDSCGNEGSCLFTVTVAPNDPPEISCPDTLTVSTDDSLCNAAVSPGFPVLVSGTPPIIYTWEMTGATTGSGTGPIAPDPYTFNRGLTIITWIASNIAGKDTCQQVIIVNDNEPPSFDIPDPFVFCVMDIDTASWNLESEPLTEIEPERPDYYLIAPGNTLLDLDTATYHDNCCDPEEPEKFLVYWRIDFSDGTSLPPLPGTYIPGQPSAYGVEIYLPGDGVLFNDLIHTITYRLADCFGNLSDPALPVTITIKPRPNIIKIY